MDLIVQTVAGPINPMELGPTLMHEHLLLDLCPPSLRPPVGTSEVPIGLCDCFKLNWGQTFNPANMRLVEELDLVGELEQLYAAGGRTLVELTVGGLKPDPEGLARLSLKSGIHIVMGCGYYVHDYQDADNLSRSSEDFAQEMIHDLTIGAWGTNIRAGIIGEIGCQSPWTDQEKRVMRGALMAQRQTGAAVNVHPGRSNDQPFEVAAFVRSFGAPLDRIILSHIDRTLFTTDEVLRLADTGVVVEFDLFGWETSSYWPNPEIDMPNDAIRLRLIRALIDHGHLSRILISHDICTRTRLVSFGGHGYQHIFANVVPLMRRRGFDEAEIRALLVDNPRRLLALPR